MAQVVGIVILAGTLALSSQTQAAEPAQVVTMKGFEFKPARITIRVGETVKWKNTDSQMHTVTADPEKAINPKKNVQLPEGAETFASGKMQPGDTYRHTFTVPGLYRYFCIPHETVGMVAEVEVKSDKMTQDEEQPAQESAPSTEQGEQIFFFQLLHWLGKFHPVVVHFPIALLVAAAVAELLLMSTGRELFDASSRFCVWGSALTAPVAGLLGWFFAGFRLDDPSWIWTTHRWLGTSTTVLALLALLLGEMSRRKDSYPLRNIFRATLFLAVVLVLVAGFFGGAIVYGLDHYAW